MKPGCPVSPAVSRVVTMPNVIVAAAVPAKMYPSASSSHSIVCCVDAASVPEATVSVMTMEDDVAAVSVAVLPTATVHNGTFDVTKIGEFAVMVMVSTEAVAFVATVLAE